jgi:phosphate-selective porin OprO/OprP
VFGSFLLTGEDAVNNGPVVPKRPFVPFFGRMGPGAWEVVRRYSQLTFSSNDPVDFFDGNIGNGIPGGRSTADNGAQSITAGVNWYANSRTRVMLDYSQYWYETELGTPFSCNQSSCGAGNPRGRGDTNYEIQTRLQIWF